MHYALKIMLLLKVLIVFNTKSNNGKNVDRCFFK